MKELSRLAGVIIVPVTPVSGALALVASPLDGFTIGASCNLTAR